MVAAVDAVFLDTPPELDSVAPASSLVVFSLPRSPSANSVVVQFTDTVPPETTHATTHLTVVFQNEYRYRSKPISAGPSHFSLGSAVLKPVHFISIAPSHEPSLSALSESSVDRVSTARVLLLRLTSLRKSAIRILRDRTAR